ncbi:hypothetical protein TL5118_02570 [Thalassovita autumnalis]|uniref:Uncharacterized protein n=1 Tax=Thalassovita autumnalis TaxID=2072972 RepID=A0A0P1FWZ6_9RHOB|nr:hypothetical protein TL5118_02570 [Thalassovita autumnalis]CUH73440.1 hypothetical protein TL5120_03249 [Thalassovita autumnalis]
MTPLPSVSAERLAASMVRIGVRCGDEGQKLHSDVRGNALIAWSISRSGTWAGQTPRHSRASRADYPKAKVDLLSLMGESSADLARRAAELMAPEPLRLQGLNRALRR